MPIAPSRSEPDVSAPWLLILRSSPYAGPRFGEAIDLALVAGVFERSLTVLLIDDAVQALRQSQHGERAGQHSALVPRPIRVEQGEAPPAAPSSVTPTGQRTPLV